MLSRPITVQLVANVVYHSGFRINTELLAAGLDPSRTTHTLQIPRDRWQPAVQSDNLRNR